MDIKALAQPSPYAAGCTASHVTMTIPLYGYSDRLSARPGQTLRFKVSSEASGPFEARLVRIRHADPNPAGPGMKIDDLGHVFQRRCASRVQPLNRGSYVRVQDAPLPLVMRNFTVGARVLPTAPGRGPQCVISSAEPGDPGGWLLGLEPGAVVAEFNGQRLRLETALPSGWCDLWFSADAAAGWAELSLIPLDPLDGPQCSMTTAMPPGTATRAPESRDLLIGACQSGGEVRQHFNGRIEAPYIRCDGETFAAWDFGQDIDSLFVRDTGPRLLHGTLVNLPTRAVRSSRWSGREHCWRHAPDQYAAIHFHDDDLHDAGWDDDFSFQVPESLDSGLYAMRLSAGQAVDHLPFFVSAALGRPRARVVFVAPTYTYLAYGNHARGRFDPELRGRVASWGAYPHSPDQHPQVGLSTYNLHADASGVCLASRWRPLLSLRPGVLAFNDAHGSGVRHLCADTHLLDWLAHEGIGVDVVTDDELEAEGAALLAPYALVLTGTHCEYQSTATWDAYAGYLRGGGRLAYLGGNGFYYRVGVSPQVPGVLEVRRAGGGTRGWDMPPGEHFHMLDGELGGLWRSSDRPPHRLVGVGFSAQGPFVGSGYRVRPEARQQPGGWILQGVADGLIGDYGLSGGGAAGFELDSTSHADGSPARCTLLARSEGHGRSYGAAHDMLLWHMLSRDRKPPSTLLHAEMIFWPTPAGGWVFATGSITFCGSLSHGGYRNDISALLGNVVRGALAGR